MNISIIGSRGIPNLYGGYEKFTERIGVDLAKKGYHISVSCEHSKEKKPPLEYNGVSLFYFPIRPPKSRTLRQAYEILYDAYSLLKASQNSDCIYMLGYGASMFFFIPRIFGKTLIVNSDGIEWKRNKFNRLEKSLIKACEKLMVVFADKIIADSREVKKYLDARYNIDTKFIPYGVSEMPHVAWDNAKLPDNLSRGKIQPNEYWLVAARLEPENNIHTIVEGHLKSESKKPLIIVGSFSSPKYEKFVYNLLTDNLKNNEDIFICSDYSRDLLYMLRQNCFAYIHGHSVGGTSPALLVAMIMKKIILANDNEFTREVCDDFALYFKDTDDLGNKITLIEKNPENYFKLKEDIYKRAKEEYSDDKILNEYISLFNDVMGDTNE